MLIKVCDYYLNFDTDKNVVSMRDGIYKYKGFELGLNDRANEVIRVYRSPLEVVKAQDSLIGLPVTVDHVDLDKKVENPVGTIKSSSIDYVKDNVILKNVVTLDAEGLEKRKKYCKLSLGYGGTLKDSDNPNYDYEMVDIKPHHLALVERARGGSELKVLDGGMYMEEEEKKDVKDEKEEKKDVMDGLEGRLKKIEDALFNKEEKKDDEKKSVKDSAVNVQDSFVKIKDEAINDYRNSQIFSDELNKYAIDRVKILDKANKMGLVFKDSNVSNLELKKEILSQKGKNFTDSLETNIAFEMLEVPKKECRVTATDSITKFLDSYGGEDE